MVLDVSTAASAGTLGETNASEKMNKRGSCFDSTDNPGIRITKQYLNAQMERVIASKGGLTPPYPAMNTRAQKIRIADAGTEWICRNGAMISVAVSDKPATTHLIINGGF